MGYRLDLIPDLRYHCRSMKVITKNSTEKQEQLLFYLKFGTVMLWIDGRDAEVVLPAGLKSLYQVRLNLDYGFEAADIRILPERVEATLSFGKDRFACIIPLHAVYMLVSNPTETGCIFPDSVPPEMLELMDQTRPKTPPQARAPELASAQTQQALIEPESQTGTAPAPKRKGHLRVIK